MGHLEIQVADDTAHRVVAGTRRPAEAAMLQPIAVPRLAATAAR
ncbi:MAG TPA: hypothetical protein VHW69_10005 [Rhizomicrobium sp.]|nr:hypothetical protein [Rhizomicrobium sp.]